MATKNLGQVAGVHIGTTPPTNIALIWYDSTPSQMFHKVYDAVKKQWVVLDQNIISSITYSELTNIAKNVGLSAGKFYQITDRSNALALAITSTKVQYTDSLGNILVDDLGTNIQYHVTSSNLQIDDVVGVFDETNRKLVFRFNEYTPDITADDYILGKVKRNNVWSLAKYKLSSFISKVTGNSITWNGGFFFNFSQAIQNILDKKGGVVSKDAYDKDLQTINQNVGNVGKENQEIVQNAQKAINIATTEQAIYNKKCPSVSVNGEPTDIIRNDTLLTIVSKIQRWINRFKYASGIRLSSSFSSENSKGKVNNNDTVETAIEKLQNQQNNTRLSLPDDWKTNTKTNQNAQAGEGYDSVFGKIEADRQTRNNLTTELTDLTLNSGAQNTVKYRISNGMLEIIIDKKALAFWFYTETVVNDTIRFFPFAFTQEKISELKPFFNIPDIIDKAYVMQPLITIPLGMVQKDALDGWIKPTYNIPALVSLGYGTYSDGGTIKYSLGLALTPLSKTSVNAESLQVEEVDDGATFQSLFEEDVQYVRYWIPPMVIRYKLF